MIWVSMVISGAGLDGVGRDVEGMFLVEVSVARGARDTGVPDIVIAGEPGTRVWVPIIKIEAEFAVIACVPNVITGKTRASDVDTAGNSIVLSSRTTAVAEGARDTGVPDMLIAGAPGTRVWPSIMYSASEEGDIGTVLLAMTTKLAESAREITVPKMVIAASPGIRVWLPIRYWDAELADTMDVPRVIAGATIATLAFILSLSCGTGTSPLAPGLGIKGVTMGLVPEAGVGLALVTTFGLLTLV